MAGWHYWLNGHGFGWTQGVDGQGGLACCNSWGRKESDTAERLNWTEWSINGIFYWSGYSSLYCYFFIHLFPWHSLTFAKGFHSFILSFFYTKKRMKTSLYVDKNLVSYFFLYQTNHNAWETVHENLVSHFFILKKNHIAPVVRNFFKSNKKPNYTKQIFSDFLNQVLFKFYSIK